MGYVMTARAVRAAHAHKPLKGVLAMSPANPSGTMIGRAGLADLGAACREAGSGSSPTRSYHGLTYDAPARPRSPSIPMR